MSNSIQKILGDSVSRVIIKLTVLSLIVGVVMTVVGWSPKDIFNMIVGFFRYLSAMGFSTFSTLLNALLIGAAIVIPIFIIIRILDSLR